MHSHRPSTALHQSNKPFKSRHSSKGQLKAALKGRVSRPSTTATTATKQSVNAQLNASTKANRRNQQRQIQQKRRLDRLQSMRSSTAACPPRLVAIVPLTSDTSSHALLAPLVRDAVDRLGAFSSISDSITGTGTGCSSPITRSSSIAGSSSSITGSSSPSSGSSLPAGSSSISSHSSLPAGSSSLSSGSSLTAAFPSSSAPGRSVLVDFSKSRQFKQRQRVQLQLMPLSRSVGDYAHFVDVLDACKVADFVLFLLSAKEEVDQFGLDLLAAIRAQGLPSSLAIVQV
jgi:hypothetical protein